MACINAPMIVAEDSLINENSTFGPVSLFTPSSDGLYRVTIYTEVLDNSGISFTVNCLSYLDSSFAYLFSFEDTLEAMGSGGVGMSHVSNGQAHTISL